MQNKNFLANFKLRILHRCVKHKVLKGMRRRSRPAEGQTTSLRETAPACFCGSFNQSSHRMASPPSPPPLPPSALDRTTNRSKLLGLDHNSRARPHPFILLHCLAIERDPVDGAMVARTQRWLVKPRVGHGNARAISERGDWRMAMDGRLLKVWELETWEAFGVMERMNGARRVLALALGLLRGPQTQMPLIFLFTL